MNILFLTLVKVDNLKTKGIYQDLCRKFRDERHRLTIVFPLERRSKQPTTFYKKDNVNFLGIKTLNITKVNFIEKGLGTLFIEHQYVSAIKKHLSDIQFNLVLYSTPPITFYNPIKYIKNRDNALSYLLLKDIFPQNAIDIGMMKQNSLLHRFFRAKEKKLYSISDYIGCMSPKNVEFILNHNPELETNRVEICPNSIELEYSTISTQLKNDIKDQYNIPENVTTFIYGGNLGKPQGIDFLLEVLSANHNKKDRFFIIIGSGTEYNKINNWAVSNKPNNAIIKKRIPKEEYNLLIQSCDVGLIFLDPRFTIPNYPSRLLPYLQFKKPVLMAVDKNTDIGTMAEKNGYGRWCQNGDLSTFNTLLDELCENKDTLITMGDTGYSFLKNNYTTNHSYQIIMKHFQ